jgi:hypothetical protein
MVVPEAKYQLPSSLEPWTRSMSRWVARSLSWRDSCACLHTTKASQEWTPLLWGNFHKFSNWKTLPLQYATLDEGS